MREMAQRIAQRFLAKQAPDAREKARENTQPINKPDGIAIKTQETNETVPNGNPDETPINHKDIQPTDVFSPGPDTMGVLNLAETGKDLQKAIDDEVPENKGYDAVRNLSQYLIKTEGGGGAEPVGED